MTQEEKAERNRAEVRRIRGELRLLRLDCAVRVEGKYDTDELFWSHIMRNVLPDLSFKVYRYANYPTTQAFGKSNVLKFKEFAAQDFILCVDSDYDYLLEREDLNHPFIFQTYTYSVENYQCYATSLLPILKRFLDLETADYGFVDLMNRYSSIIHRLLVYSLFSMKIDGEFSADKCGHAIGFDSLRDIELGLTDLVQNIENQCLILGERYDVLPEFSDFKLRIAELGLTESNAYLFIRGHDLKDKVIKKFLERIAEPLKNVEFEQRRRQNGGEAAAQYQEHLRRNSFDNLLKTNMNYTDCSFYQKIKTDLRTAFRV
jgi:Protein of unknown function (DUF4435)